jgi:hypothetical protein
MDRYDFTVAALGADDFQIMMLSAAENDSSKFLTAVTAFY